MCLQGSEKRFDYVAVIQVRCSDSVLFASGERRGSFALTDGLDHRLARVLTEVPDEIEAEAARAKARGSPPSRSSLALRCAQESVRAEWQAMPPLPSGCGLQEAVNIVTQNRQVAIG